MMTNENGFDLPSGFRFSPTDVELVRDYLCLKCESKPLPASNIIAEVELYKVDPMQLPALATYGESEWYFFTPRDRKYPNGSRPNRATRNGYWKVTGHDKSIGESVTIGVKQSLGFYSGTYTQGVKTDWVMNEYRLANVDRSGGPGKNIRLDEWVLCRIYHKKGINFVKEQHSQSSISAWNPRERAPIMRYEQILHLPSGFRFTPTDMELIQDYLYQKYDSRSNFATHIIPEVDLYKFDPWQLPALATYGEKYWYFFTPSDRKYLNRPMSKRAAVSGYWKANGLNKLIGEPNAIGVKQQLVFYSGKFPAGVKTNWLMHEYRLANVDRSAGPGKNFRLDDWVLCRIYHRGRNHVEERNPISPSISNPVSPPQPNMNVCSSGFEMVNSSNLMQDGEVQAADWPRWDGFTQGINPVEEQKSTSLSISNPMWPPQPNMNICSSESEMVTYSNLMQDGEVQTIDWSTWDGFVQGINPVDEQKSIFNPSPPPQPNMNIYSSGSEIANSSNFTQDGEVQAVDWPVWDGFQQGINPVEEQRSLSLSISNTMPPPEPNMNICSSGSEIVNASNVMQARELQAVDWPVWDDFKQDMDMHIPDELFGSELQNQIYWTSFFDDTFNSPKN